MRLITTPWSWVAPTGERVGGRLVDPLLDAPRLHAWLTHPRSRFWDMLDATVEQIQEAYTALDTSPHEQAWLGHVEGEPLFLAEFYDPHHHPVADVAPVEDGDVGMHLLVAPPIGAPQRGLTTLIMHAVMERCWSLPGCRRVVVEPDHRHQAIVAKNAAVGFVPHGLITLPSKTALFSVCTRDTYVPLTLAAAS